MKHRSKNNNFVLLLSKIKTRIHINTKNETTIEEKRKKNVITCRLRADVFLEIVIICTQPTAHQQHFIPFFLLHRFHFSVFWFFFLFSFSFFSFSFFFPPMHALQTQCTCNRCTAFAVMFKQIHRISSSSSLVLAATAYRFNPQ